MRRVAFVHASGVGGRCKMMYALAHARANVEALLEPARMSGQGTLAGKACHLRKKGRRSTGSCVSR